VTALFASGNRLEITAKVDAQGLNKKISAMKEAANRGGL
jgi:hypothetical protein